MKILPSVDIVFTTNKLRNVVSNLRSSVPFVVKSRLVYKIRCPRCMGPISDIQYDKFQYEQRNTLLKVSQSTLISVNVTLSSQDFETLESANNQKVLIIMEALYIRQQKPLLNTKDEFRRRSLSYVF